MKKMIFDHFGGTDTCSTPEEAEKVFSCTVNGVNSFWISDGQDPVLSILVKDELAYAILFPDEGSAGIQAYADEPPEGDSTVFYINTPAEEIAICNEYVIPKPVAKQIMLEFVETQSLPDFLEWEEL